MAVSAVSPTPVSTRSTPSVSRFEVNADSTENSEKVTEDQINGCLRPNTSESRPPTADPKNIPPKPNEVTSPMSATLRCHCARSSGATKAKVFRSASSKRNTPPSRNAHRRCDRVATVRRPNRASKLTEGMGLTPRCAGDRADSQTECGRLVDGVAQDPDRGDVDHHAVDGDRAESLFFCSVEGRDELAGVVDLLAGRGEFLVCEGDLARVDGPFAGEAQGVGEPCLA